jgi:hypothetical protein
MFRYGVDLRSDEAATATRLEHLSEEQIGVGDVITVGGLQILVDDIAPRVGGTPVLECRRLWKLRLRDTDGRTVGAGFILNEQRQFGDVQTLILDGDERYRVVSVEQEWPLEFDGAIVVEPLTLKTVRPS